MLARPAIARGGVLFWISITNMDDSDGLNKQPGIGALSCCHWLLLHFGGL
jgi:hypothetical protein